MAVRAISLPARLVEELESSRESLRAALQGGGGSWLGARQSAQGVVDVGDWVPMRRPRSLEKVVKKKYAGASVPVATTSARPFEGTARLLKSAL